jgi:hypothetical protein
LTFGPKPVRPHLLTEKDIAKEFSSLICELIPLNEEESPLDLLARSLRLSPIGGPIIFVFDNFETVSNPVELFRWLDTYIRPPNKVLITTRFREFRADYQVEVGGMGEDEAKELINLLAAELRIPSLLSEKTINEIYQESDGHPYIIKMLLGEIARHGKTGTVERVVAGKDEILDALFDRSYARLSPGAQLVFLTLCSWRSTIPRVALEAVLLRPSNELLDVGSALHELERSSFIEVSEAAEDAQQFLIVPLAAAIFGRKRLQVAPVKLSVEANMQLLLFFGHGQRNDMKAGIGPRVDRFVRKVAQEITAAPSRLESYRPILEYLSRQYPKGWLLLAELYEELGDAISASDAIEANRRYIQAEANSEEKRAEGWTNIVRLSKRLGRVHTI